MYTVYKHLNNEEQVIYIGKSKSLLHRQRQHSKNSEWFDEIDSIEYCVLDSKIEMDIVELYLINTLNPKYNKKDKRDDKVENISIKELEWLEFDMCELEINEKYNNKIKNIQDSYENFVLRNITKATHVSCYVENGVLGNINGSSDKSTGYLELIKGLNVNNKVLITKCGNIYNIKDLILYKIGDLIEGYDSINKSFFEAYVLFDIKNKDLVLPNISNEYKMYCDKYEMDFMIKYIQHEMPTVNELELFKIKFESI